jgi:hypothetical protein
VRRLAPAWLKQERRPSRRRARRSCWARS